MIKISFKKKAKKQKDVYTFPLKLGQKMLVHKSLVDSYGMDEYKEVVPKYWKGSVIGAKLNFDGLFVTIRIEDSTTDGCVYLDTNVTVSIEELGKTIKIA